MKYSSTSPKRKKKMHAMPVCLVSVKPYTNEVEKLYSVLKKHHTKYDYLRIEKVFLHTTRETPVVCNIYAIYSNNQQLLHILNNNGFHNYVTVNEN